MRGVLEQNVDKERFTQAIDTRRLNFFHVIEKTFAYFALNFVFFEVYADKAA